MIDTAIEAAREAGKLLRLHLGRVKDIRQKSGQEKNLVTEIDRQSEEVIKQIIGRRHPSHSILAEESGRKGAPESEFTWVIDPLDGTTNYTHAFPVFCVSIAVEHKGAIILGVIYDPNFDELFVAERGKGAFLNGKRIRVSGIDSLIPLRRRRKSGPCDRTFCPFPHARAGGPANGIGGNRSGLYGGGQV